MPRKAEVKIEGGCCLLIGLAFILYIVGLAWLYEVKRNGMDCLGFDDNAKRIKGVEYEVSTANVIIGILGIQTVVVPVYIALSDLYCPVEK